jgi:predicted ABC-type ATPase
MNFRQSIACLICGVVFSTQALYSAADFFFSPEVISQHLDSYSPQEKEEIAKDLEVVRSVCFGKNIPKNADRPFYLATAGAPGSRKSTILERFLQSHPEYSAGLYLDRNERALKFMAHTYYAHSLNALCTGSSPDYLEVRKAAYEKWRGASNYIILTLLEEAFQKKASVVHGTNLTGAHVAEFLQKLRAEGYRITLILCGCEDSVRKEAVEYRNNEQRFYQSTPEDAVSKGKFFSEKLRVYFAHADTLYLYWSDDLFSEERLAAVFQNGEIDVEQECALDLFVCKYDQEVKALNGEGKDLPSWDELIEKYKSRFKK